MKKNASFFSNKSSGEISKNLIILIGVVIVVSVVAVISIISLTKKPPPPPPPEEPKTPEPVYATTVGNIQFNLIDSKDLGSALLGSTSKYPSTQRDATTTDKFIEVTISAENIGKENTAYGDWDLLEVIDNEGREFSSSQLLNAWVSSESECGSLLKPGFTPILCSRIYEVAKVSTSFKVKINSNAGKGTKTEAFLDLKLGYVSTNTEQEEETTSSSTGNISK